MKDGCRQKAHCIECNTVAGLHYVQALDRRLTNLEGDFGINGGVIRTAAGRHRSTPGVGSR
jgi:hypothetical protein